VAKFAPVITRKLSRQQALDAYHLAHFEQVGLGAPLEQVGNWIDVQMGSYWPNPQQWHY